MPKKDTRNYGKRHPRFFQGGSVLPDYAELERRAGERASREGLAWNREHKIGKEGAGRPEDYERKPEEMVVKKPDEGYISQPYLYYAKDI